MSFNKKILKLFFPFLVIICSINIANGANEIRNAIFHEYNDSSYLILHVYDFHPVGGSYEQGNERVSGYNDSEIRIYNLATRKLVAVKDFGPNNDLSAIEVLGCSDSTIWVYSMHYNSGLQGLNLYSLNRQISQANIYNKLSAWQGRFVNPNWNEIRAYYGYNSISNSIIVTNYLEKRYKVNTQTFKIEQVDSKFQVTRKKPDHQSRVIFSDKDTLNIYNDLFHKNKVEYLPNNTFLEGSFIIEQNANKQYIYFNELLLFYNDVLEKTNETLAKIRASKESTTYQKLTSDKLWYEQKVSDTKDNIKALQKNKKPDKLLLSSTNNSFYILHKKEKTNDSFIAISKLSNGDNNYTLNWETTIPGMFFNIQTARGTKIFKRYFGDFMPEGSEIYIEEINGALIIINQMQVCSINCKNGEINWRFKL